MFNVFLDYSIVLVWLVVLTGTKNCQKSTFTVGSLNHPLTRNNARRIAFIIIANAFYRSLYARFTTAQIGNVKIAYWQN